MNCERNKSLGKSIGMTFTTASAFRKKASKDKGSAGKVPIGAQFPRIYTKGDFNAGHRGGRMISAMLRKMITIRKPFTLKNLNLPRR